MKKTILALVLSVITMFAFVGCGGSSDTESTDEATAAVIASQDLTDCTAVTKGAGYFNEEMGDGVDVSRMAAGRDMITAMKSGDANFAGPLGICPTIVGLTTGTDYKVIYVASLIRGTEGLVVRESTGFETVADLKGQKIGVTLASSGHYGMLCALEDAGLTTDDVEILDMAPDAIFAAWERGDIDVAYTWNPTLTNLANKDGKIILTAADLAKAGHQTINFHIVNTEFAEAHPDVVAAYVRALKRGNEYYESDKEDAQKVVSEYLEMDLDVVEQQMSDVYPGLDRQLDDDVLGNDNAAKAMLQVAEFLQKAGQIDDAKDLDFYKAAIDTTFIEQVQGE
ncbi:MAG: ABC transporter substrate-binding protein [Firmicutes bacterium]|nr:ABC transporter substrate-binding protein [Bacillota bacterium]